MTNPNDSAHPEIYTDRKGSRDLGDVYGDTYSVGGLTKHELFAKDILCALLSNPERYKYIAEQVESGKLSQESATEKNVNKALLITDALIRGLNATAENQK